jgi:hypothetical protein
MRKAHFHIDHPAPYDVLKPTVYACAEDEVEYWFFAAQGRTRCFSCKSESLLAWLIPHDGGAAIQGKLLLSKNENTTKPGMNWIFGFEGITPCRDQTGMRFHLFVGQTGASKNIGNLATSVEFALLEHDGPLTGGNIPVDRPRGDSVVPSTFYACGSLLNNAPVTGATLKGNGMSFDGVVVSDVPAGTWMYKFSNIPDNSGYTFNVSDGTNYGSVDDITVDSTVSPPSSAPPPPPPPPG